MSAGSIILTILLLAVVGAFIGGITNHLAIKMLFRPYKAIYLGKLRVPFTPGVIPKRHDEIAVQLGHLVIKHLITAEGLEKRFLDERFKKGIQTKMTSWMDRYLEEKRPTKEDLMAYFPIDTVSYQLQDQLIKRGQSFLKDKLDEYEMETLEQVLPKDLLEAVENGLPQFSRHFANSIRAYFETDEAKGMVKSQLDKFFEGRGMLGNMLNMFLGNQSLVDLFYPDLLKFLEQPTVQLTIYDLLEKEWKKVKSKPLKELSEQLHLNELSEKLVASIIEASPLRKMIENPGIALAEWKEAILEQIIPLAVTVLLKKASVEAANLLQSFELDALVSDQVRAFSMQELENVILIISKKEFKMITYLGALLGGIIGLVQALVMLLIQK